MATAIPTACLTSSAIRCRDVETGPNLGVLAVFPSNWKWQGEKGPFGNVKRTPLTGAHQRVFFCRAWAVWFRWAALRR